MLIDVVKARLAAQVPALVNRIEGVAQLADIMARNALPQHTAAAFVVPLGLIGRNPDAMAGLFRQDVEERIGVVLTLRSYDPKGGRGLDPLQALIEDVIGAVAGWGPDDAPGVFALSRGQLVDMSTGTIVYQLEFALTDQLRITP